jgi:DNA polymerase-1
MTGGTVTGRFSYQNPNLQQIPARNKDLGPKIRSLFIPEEGCKWGVFDYSQQEPRLVVHYASLYKLPSVYDVIDAYNTDSNADFHQTVADMAQIPRSQAKTINLGLFYGMGKAKLQAELGVTKEKAAELFNTYHQRVPFVKQLMEKASNRAQDRGQIRTCWVDYAGFTYGNLISLVCIKHCLTKKHSGNMDQGLEELTLTNH